MIGELVTRLVQAGTDPALAAEIVAEAFAAGASLSGGNRVDVQLEKRRAWDREYRRKQRESRVESGGIHPKSDVASTLKEDKKESKRRAERLPPDWKPTEADVEFAISKGATTAKIEFEAEKFRNYWTAKSGRDAAKLDWPATWRNWILSALERSGGPMPTAPPPLNSQPEWKKPPWEREGISEVAWRERELGKTNGAQVRRDS